MRIIACADTMLERDRDGDRAKATSLIDDSLAISNELGMRPLMERVLSRSRSRGIRHKTGGYVHKLRSWRKSKEPVAV